MRIKSHPENVITNIYIVCVCMYIYTIIHAFVQIDIKQAKESAALHITLGDKCHPLHMAIARFTQTTSKASS